MSRCPKLTSGGPGSRPSVRGCLRRRSCRLPRSRGSFRQDAPRRPGPRCRTSSSPSCSSSRRCRMPTAWRCTRSRTGGGRSRHARTSSERASRTGRSGAILDGWACRYRRLEDGRRQVSALLLPGDLCDTHVTVLRAIDHSIGALTPVTVAEIPRDRLDRLVGYHPRLGRALWREMLAAASIQREWTVNMARREESSGSATCSARCSTGCGPPS
ncbi:Crp/Fnr family transcriptional regulator [Methylobacterium oryzae CBMB20]